MTRNPVAKYANRYNKPSVVLNKRRHDTDDVCRVCLGSGEYYDCMLEKTVVCHNCNGSGHV